jgi:hypothetical protein
MNIVRESALPTIGSPGPRNGGSRCFVHTAAIAPATAFAKSSCAPGALVNHVFAAAWRAPFKPDQLARKPVNVE